MSIAIENLSFSYGRFEALRGITARAEAGRITAVLGPNAAGKSTLLRCMIGALRPSSGRVMIDKDQVHRISASLLAQRIAYVPQRSIVSAAFMVRQVVQLGRYALTPDPRKVELAIERLDLAGVADWPYPELSVGQQQRVTIARALAQLGPRGHLILDEPVSAMDLRHSHQCMSIFRELAEAGATVILAVHDLSLAAAVADEAWLLDRGELVSAGTIAEVMSVDGLERVFGVAFGWIEAPWGGRILAARPAGAEVRLQSGSHG